MVSDASTERFAFRHQDLLAVLLHRYTRARVVVGNGRSAVIKTFQRVIDLPYVVTHLLMRADVPQENIVNPYCQPPVRTGRSE
jgi:hypothetical protein